MSPATTAQEKIRIDSDHRYFMGSITVPGFTEICKDLGIIKENRFYTDEGRDVGTKVHEWCLFLAQGNESETGPDSRIKGRVNGFRKFLNESLFSFSFGEIPQNCGTSFACTPDLVGHIGVFSVVIDIKAGAPQKWHRLQLAAQKIALADGGFKAQKAYSLYLRDDSYRLIEHETKEDEYRWKAFVAAYHAKKRYA